MSELNDEFELTLALVNLLALAREHAALAVAFGLRDIDADVGAVVTTQLVAAFDSDGVADLVGF